jgi:predicted amidophosphoribosyltransferase
MYDDWDSEYDDEYGPDSDYEDDWESETIVCSHCGADVYEDAVACPVCGEYLTKTTHPLSDRPAWWVSLGILGVIATILCLIFLA